MLLRKYLRDVRGRDIKGQTYYHSASSQPHIIVLHPAAQQTRLLRSTNGGGVMTGSSIISKRSCDYPHAQRGGSRFAAALLFLILAAITVTVRYQQDN